MSVKAPDDDGKQRAVVLDMETRMDNLEAALERGRKRASDIRNVLGAAQKVKENRKEAKTYSRKSSGDEYSEYSKKLSSVHKAETPIKPVSNVIKEESPVDRLKAKAMNNPYGALGAQGTIKLDEPARKKQNETYEKKTVVIVDGDVKTRKLCALFLTQNYKVVSLDSGIKTVDFFVKNHADLLIINPVLPGMSGTSTAHSVHMQPGCGEVPVMYLVDDEFTEARSHLVGPHVVGILNKPIKRETIAQAVEGLFGTRADS